VVPAAIKGHRISNITPAQKKVRSNPLPFTDRSTEAVEHTWQALHWENEFLRVMVLPEIGGRIHVGMDKTNGYDFFYRQNVIKPALVGLPGRGFPAA